MREIKFRAWDSRYNCMYNWNELALEEKQVFITDGDLYRQYDDALHVMQYTDLKDKNGKEIYEGDVVLFVEEVIVETIEGYHRTEPEGNIGSVNFEKGAYYIQTPGNTNAFYSWGEQMFSWDELEVIGNIYENPELLTNN